MVTRPGVTLEAAVSRAPGLGSRVGRTIDLIEAATPAVSSTEIRARLRAGAPVGGMVADAVAEHIASHELYRKGPVW